MSAYVENQRTLAATAAGVLAATMRPGQKWVTESGDVVTVWMTWSPDVDGEAEGIADRYKWAPPAADHNSEIGITHPTRRTLRVPVASVAGWRLLG